MSTVTIISVSAVGLSHMRALGLRSPWRERLNLRLQYIGRDALHPADWEPIFASIQGADILLLDLMGTPKDLSGALVQQIAGFTGHVVVLHGDSMAIRTLTRLGGFSMAGMAKESETGEPPSLDAIQRMMAMVEKVGTLLPVGKLRDMRNYLWLVRYWQFANPENCEQMLRLLARDYLGHSDLPKPEPPQTLEQVAIYDPVAHRVYPDLRHYRAEVPAQPHRPNVAVLFRNTTYPVDLFPIAGRLCQRLQSVCNVVPIAISRAVGNDLERLRTLLAADGQPQVDLIVNLLAFRLGQGPIGGDPEGAVALLRAINVPVLHPFVLTRRSVADWQANDQGAQVGEFLISIFLPELDGCIETYPIGAMQPNRLGFEEATLIEERIERLVARVQRWIALRRKPNAEKRVAIITYDYPPGEGNVGCGAFLDSFASLAAILRHLADNGYTVTPWDATELKERFVADGQINTPQWKQPHRTDDHVIIEPAVYHALTRDCPQWNTIRTFWGEAPGQIMREGAGVRIPGICNGNIFLGVQPSRGAGEQHVQQYHDTRLPPHHQYVAFYRWLEEVFRADAIIHLGTHGTLEFLPGKEKAVSGACFPDYLIGNAPHFYVYYSGNPTEAMIAKRRTHATIISHLPPPFIRSDLYGDLSELRALMSDYVQAGNLNPEQQASILDRLTDRVRRLGWTWEGIEALEQTLYEYESSLIPGRMHCFGQRYTDEEAREFLVQTLRVADGERPSLFELLCRDRRLHWRTIQDAPERHTEVLTHLEKDAHAWVQKYVIEGQRFSRREQEWQRVYVAACAIRDGLQQCDELGGLVRALSGGYLPVGMGGDLFRSPDILPTGRNLVQFDPRRAPTDAALERGAAIAAATLDHYRQTHGRYPRQTAVILWGLETAKTQGETIGQILAYLGVQLRRRGVWETRLEIIPLAELKRPRVDVTIQMCGFFRDMFPNLIELLQEAISLVAAQDEDDDHNPVRCHTRRLYNELRAQGASHNDAEDLATARLFGPQNTLYGAGVDQLIKSQAWQNPAELAACYTDSLRYVYTRRRYGEAMPHLLNAQLTHVELISQVRSSRDYEMTDLDHYYEFYGGLACSVKAATGRQAHLMVADTTEGRIRAEPLQRAIQRGLRTRLLNPRWLDAMLKHDYHGAQQIAKRLEHMVGLAATTEAVDPALFEAANRCLIADETLRKRIEQNNPYALLEVVDRLLEAHHRKYWQPSDDDLARLQALRGQLEDRLEGIGVPQDAGSA